MDPELIRQLLGDLVSGSIQAVPVSTADSIFRVLGAPERPIRTGVVDATAMFSPAERQITYDPLSLAFQYAVENTPEAAATLGIKPASRNIAEVLAHELAHQASVGERGGFETTDPQVAGLLNLFLDRFETLTPQQHHSAYLEYSGGREPRGAVPEILKTQFPAGYRPTEIETQEIFAEAVQRGFGLLRNQATPEEVGRMDERLPGTREAVNFWRRMLGG